MLPGAGKQFGATHAAPADVNGDGMIDVLATRGHGVGVLWFEGPGWIEHMIDETIDSTHSTDFGDIDGDGDIDMSTVGYESKLASLDSYPTVLISMSPSPSISPKSVE